MKTYRVSHGNTVRLIEAKNATEAIEQFRELTGIKTATVKASFEY